MKNEHQENGALSGPLILMVPASNLEAVMTLDWLDRTNQAAVSAQTHLIRTRMSAHRPGGDRPPRSPGSRCGRNCTRFLLCRNWYRLKNAVHVGRHGSATFRIPYLSSIGYLLSAIGYCLGASPGNSGF
jgi:hypothetical protein